MPDSAVQGSSQARNPPALRPPASILRNRSFILLWCAYTISAFGDHLSEMALLDMQHALDRADSTRIMAIMTFVFFVPYFLFGPAMGWLADRLPRKWIMIAADLIRAALLATLFLTFEALFRFLAGSSLEISPATGEAKAIFSPWVYAAPLLVVGLFAAMFSPSRAAMLPTLVRTSQIIRANGLMNAMGPIAAIASYLLGAYLAKTHGAEVCFRADAFTFLASATFIVFIVPPPRRAAPDMRPTQSSRSLREGLAYCASHRRVIELILFAVVFWSAATAIRSTVPALVKEILDGSLEDVANYNAAVGTGLLTGAFLIGALGETLKSQIAISWSFIFAGLSILALSAVCVLKVGFWSGAAFLFLACMFGSGILVSANALLQKTVPDYIRGRVFGVKDVVTIGGILLATGWLGIPRWVNIDRYVPLILLTVGLLLFVFGVWITRVRLRRGRFGSAITFWRNIAEFHCRLVARVRRDGVCTIPPTGPVLLVANHNSTLDPFLLISTSPNRCPSFMIAREYAQWPLFGRLVSLIDCIPVNRTGIDTASVKASLRHLAAGRALGIFPQGRVRHPDDPIEAHEGVGMLALRGGATVIPAHVSGTHHSSNVFAPFLWPQRAVVRYGPPIDLSLWRGREKDRAAYREVSEHIMARINALKPAQ
ncbi:MAG: MFS transporter [Phycisphaerae bacterium]|nr:MFS transporter [Phycisphaerae bacterium]